MLWFGFLIYLECRHKDRGREIWPEWVWCLLWIVALLIVKEPALTLLFIIVAVAYTYKKYIPFLGLVSPFVNGLVKTSLVLASGFHSTQFLLLIFIVMSARNFMGDLRDITKDSNDGAQTIPIRLGIKKDIRWIYPASLVLTTLLWGWIAGLSLPIIISLNILQLLVYPLTPR